MDNTSLPVKFSQRAISWLIISTLVWQPMAPAVAAAISPTGPASMDKAANGVPVLNIATPNGAGISHNQFKDYNVGKEGLILNNATGQLNPTQLGGIIQNNPNLRAGQEARGIINEVTGGSRSQLKGYTEVAGKAANVMVANPYGITCDGCGFINTPNATLTTGKPQFDAKGNLSALNVTGGTITVEGKGLDASNSSALSLISRATEVNAAIHAKDLKVIAGANRVGADGSISALEGEGPAPTVAVDTGALGGMYANRIHLVSSDKGVGVNLGNLNARQGDIQLDASGKLVLNNSLSNGALTVKAQNAELSGDNKAAGAATVTAQSGIALKQGSLVSDKTVSLDAGDRVDIASGKVTAGENIRLAGTGLTIDKASTADAAGAIDLNAQGNELNNAGQLTAGQAISLNGGTLSNSGTLAAKGRLDAAGKLVDNQGTLQGNGVTLKSETLNNSGTLQSAGALELSGRSLTQSGTLGAGGDAGLHFDDSIHNSGSVLVDGALTATTGDLVQNGTLSGRQALTVSSDSLSNTQGAQTASLGDVTLNVRDKADVRGEVNAGGTLTVSSDSLRTGQDAQLQGQNLNLTAGKAELGGTQAARQRLNVTARDLTHTGKSSADSITFNASGKMDNSGSLVADKTLESTAAELTNSGTGSADDIALKSTGALNNSGALFAKNQLQATSTTLGNTGTLSAVQLGLESDAIANGGLLQGTQSLSLFSQHLNNQTSGSIYTTGDLTLNLPEFTNSGLLNTGGSLRLSGDRLTNSGEINAASLTSDYSTLNNLAGGRLLATGAIELTSTQLNNAGQIAANGLNLKVDTLTNQNGGELLTAGQLTLHGGELANNGLLQGGTLSLSADNLRNDGNMLSAQDAMVKVNDTLTNSGKILGQQGLDVTAVATDNSGLVVAKALALHGDLVNSGLLQGDDALQLDGAALTNSSSGQLLSTGNTTITSDTLDNQGLMQADRLTLSTPQLTNSGLIQGNSALTLDAFSLTNLKNGELLSGKGLTLNLDTLQNDGLLQVGDQLGIHAAKFGNGGRILASNMTLSGDQLTNSGAILSDGALSADFAALENLSAGSLLAGGALTLSGSNLSNDGLWQGSDALTATGSAITTGKGARVLTGDTLSLTAGQLTTDGTLQGRQATVTVDDWQHTGSLLGSSSLLANVANHLTNGGELMSLGDTQLTAGTLKNSGSVLGSGAITLSGGSLTNSGSVQGKTLTLAPAQIINRGKLIGIEALTLGAPALAGRMSLMAVSQPAGELHNEQNGSLLTQGDLMVNSGSVTNSGSWQGRNILLDADSLNNGGSIQSAGDMQLVLSDTLVSGTGSKISANGTMALQALALTNGGEWKAENLGLKADTLNNSGNVSGVNGLTLDVRSLLQQKGSSLLSGGALTLNLPELDNQGRIQAAALEINGNELTNSGMLQGDNNLTLNMRDRITNTASGTLLSQQGLMLTAPELVNYGLIQGGGSATLTATESAHNDGRILNGGQLTLITPQLTNGGWLQATSLILNAVTAGNSGTLLAQQQGTLTGTTLNNTGTAQGGNLAVNYQQLTNSGTVLGNNALTVTAQQVNQDASGTLFSGGSLVLDSNDVDQQGQVVALGDATLKLINSMNVRGTLAAGGNLTVGSNGALVNNGVMQGQALAVSAGGVLTNNGKLTSGSGDSTLSGSHIALNSTGSLQGGGNVTLTSGSDITLDGFTGTTGNLTLNAPGSIVNTALLYAANNLYLLANSIKNQGGDILAGNSLWMQRDAAGNASYEVVNTSGNIETQGGDITIRTGHLLNERKGIKAGNPVTVDSPQQYPWLSEAQAIIPFSYFGSEGIRSVVIPCPLGMSQCRPGFQMAGGHTQAYIYVMPVDSKQTLEFMVSRTTSEATSEGDAARISSGKNTSIFASVLDNNASSILASGNIVLSGNTLNNQSWFPGESTVYRTYKYKDSTSPSTYVYIAEPQLRTENSVGGNPLRAVIQADGDITATFASTIGNTNTTAFSATGGNLLITPILNSLSQQIPDSEQQAKDLNPVDKVAVSSPQWQEQLNNALQQINGAAGLMPGASDADQTHLEERGKNLGNLDNASSLATSQGKATGNYDGKSVDINAYPLPDSSNGYFIASSDPKSPYLITVNPALDGLGQLDENLYGDLYKLLGQQPSDMPRETRSQYTDKQQFLGSSWMLERLNINPENDYRFLGDAAFDTRYASNIVLTKTGSRYLNGMGSDLEQMRYLMDNAASSQQALGLQFGVSLTTDQIAALDHSIIWWENATINGEIVMVPKVYLTPKDITVNNGSVIAANNVALTGSQITNGSSAITANTALAINSQASINNSNAGQLNAGGDMQLSALDSINNVSSSITAGNALSASSQNSISNQDDGQIKAGENLQLSALNDINNINSAISGKTIALESLDGSINNLTKTTQWNVNYGRNGYWAIGNSRSQTIVSSNASISAQDALSLDAGKNINVTGATLSAGSELAINAGENIAISANKMTTSLVNNSWNKTSVGNQESVINAGGSLAIKSGKDLSITSSEINSGDDALLVAGNDLNLNSSETSQRTKGGHGRDYSFDSTSLTSGGNLTLAAGRDLNSQAAGMAAESDIALQAGRDIALQAEATGQDYSYGSKGNMVIKKTVRQQGTEIASGGDITIQAGRDLTSNAAQVVAQKDIAVTAGENVNFNTATESDYYYKEETKKKKSLLSKKTTHTIQEDSATREKGTLLSGTSVSVEAGKNILVNGSQVVGDEEVALKAGDNIDILAATNTNSSWRFSETKKSGLMGSGGIGFTIGSSKTTHDLKQKGTTQSQSVSTVGSTGGNVTIASGGQVHLNGSDVVAGKGITVDSDNVLVTAGHDKNITDEIFKQKTAGLTLALSGTVGDAINSAVSAAQSASTQSDSRLAALQGAKAALSGYQAAQAVRLDAANGSDPSNGATVGIMLSLGAQSSKSQSHSEQDTTRSATLNAGNNLTLTANGKGQKASSGDINVEGGQLKAGQDVTLDAARDITLQAAKDTQMMTGSNSSKGGSIGVGLTAGSGGTGITVSASVNASKGNQKGNGTSWNETNIDAGNQVTLNSGRDTALSGALVNGDKVVADVGRDLTVASLQDSNNYDSKQQSVSAGASFTWGVPGGSASFSYSRDKMKSTYDSVQEQSGIYAGKGGFDITVGSHTQLDGAVLASTAEAEKNRLDTGTLGFSDIHNEADYKVEHQGVGLSTSGSMLAQGAMNAASNLLASAGGSGHAEGTTQAAVAEGTITVRDQANQKQDVADLSRDTANANGAIGQIFDKEKEQKRLQAAQMIGELGSQMAQVARTEGQIAAITAGKAELAKNKIPEPASDDAKEWEAYNKKLIATPAYKDAMDQWGTGSTIQRAIQATTAAVQGLAGGDVAAALAGGAAPFIANVIAQQIPEKNLLGRTLAHATVNAALAAAQGKDMAVAAAGAATGEIAVAIAKDAYGKTVSELSENEKQTISALATLASALAGGLIGGSGADAMAAAQTGKMTGENNGLSLSTGEMSYGQAATSWNQFAVDNNLTSEQTQEGLDRLAIGYGPSMGVTYKVKPNVKVEGMAGYGPAVKGVAEINNDYFAVSDGYTAGFGAKASATVGIDFGPYAPGIFGDMSHTYSGSFGGVIGNVGGSVGKDGIGFSFAVGPSIGLSGSSTRAKDDKLKLNGDMTEDLYRHDFR